MSESDPGLNLDFGQEVAFGLVVPAARLLHPVLQGVRVFEFQDEPAEGFVPAVESEAEAFAVEGRDGRTV